ARRYTEIDNHFANTFFAQQAMSKGTIIPRLPQDGGQLSIIASATFDFRGTGDFTPAPGGLGGLADISANQILVVDTGTRDAIEAAVVGLTPGTTAYNTAFQAAVAAYVPGGTVGGSTDGNSSDVWSPIVLAAGNLGQLGVESLLLGGTRTFIDPNTGKPY